MAGVKPTYGDVFGAIRALAGREVLVQMRSSAAGDHLTVRGQLARPELFGDQALRFTVGSAEAILHFDPLGEGAWHGFIDSDGGVMVRFQSGAVLRCVPSAAGA